MLDDDMKRLSDCGDPLETMSRVVDFENVSPGAGEGAGLWRWREGWSADLRSGAMFKVFILAAQNTVSDARMEFLIRDRLRWLRFLGFDLGAPTPDENTIS
jgi:transposase, IS5 family